jgi:hypothetical protein
MSAAHAADTKTPVAEIPFANNGGINDWRADSDRVIYVQGQNRQWFKGELLSDCIGLRYAERIAFETEASGAFNKFSSIKVDGKNCPLTSFEKSDPPPKKDKKGEAAKP